MIMELRIVLMLVTVIQARSELVSESKGCSVVSFSILALLLHLSARYGDYNSPSLTAQSVQKSFLAHDTAICIYQGITHISEKISGCR